LNVISIQSHVAYGHVGNAAAIFPLQRLGCEVWPIHTVQLSNHTGYGGWRGEVFDAPRVREVVQGLSERGVLASCDGVLSGYMGSAAIGEVVLDAVERVRLANPAARYCCDPVIGDMGQGVFVRSGIAEFMRDRAAPATDLVTPNQFELEHLTGMSTPTLAAACTAIDALHAIGPEAVLVTSLRTEETPSDALDLLASDPAGCFRVRTPLLPLVANGAGDLVAALFFFHYLRSAGVAVALASAASSTFGVLKRTAEAGAREMLLIDAQDELVAPSRHFEAEPIGRVGRGR
jgi:pyridoxine kinase